MRTFTEEERYSLCLFHALGSNAVAYRKLTMFFGSAKGVYDALNDGALDGMVSQQANERLCRFAAEEEREKLVHSLEKGTFGILFEHDASYPELLHDIQDAPPLLFYRGNLHKECSFPIGIVGSRRCTQYGKEIAERFSAELCERGATVISGLADGIDSVAAHGALAVQKEHLPTVGVLGCGIDIVYPAANRYMYDAVEKDGLIVSEYFPGIRPMPGYFPARNRIISGMSKGLLVVEAAERSGTSITAGLALEQGRDVFAIPGRITDPASAGTNRMIRDGEAKPVLCVDDILSEYSYERLGAVAPAFDPGTLSEEQRKVYDILLNGEKSFEELAVLSGYSIPLLNSVLTEMLFLGIMKQLPGRIYIVDLANI